MEDRWTPEARALLEKAKSIADLGPAAYQRQIAWGERLSDEEIALIRRIAQNVPPAHSYNPGEPLQFWESDHTIPSIANIGGRMASLFLEILQHRGDQT